MYRCLCGAGAQDFYPNGFAGVLEMDPVGVFGAHGEPFRAQGAEESSWSGENTQPVHVLHLPAFMQSV